jgi:hypothetical protein
MRPSTAAAAAAVVLALSPTAPRSDDQPGAATPTPAPKADAGPAAPPKAHPAPKAATPRGETAAKPPAAANDLARALLTSEQWGKVLDSYASSLAGQISQALLAKGEKVPDDLRGKLRGELEKTLPYQQTVQAQAEALAQQLSADELRRTATFYGSPLGRKVLDKLPEAQSQVAQELQGKLATAVPDIVNRLAPSAMTPGAPGASGGKAGGTGSGGRPEGADATSGPGPGPAGGGAPTPGQPPPPQGGATR